MKTTKKITRAIAAIVTTLFVSSSAALAVNISLNSGDYITEAVWNTLETIMAKISVWSGDDWIAITWDFRLEWWWTICAGGWPFTGTDISLAADTPIDDATWTKLEDLMANFSIDWWDWYLVYTGWNIVASWDICTYWADGLVWGWDDVCLTWTQCLTSS